MPTAALETKPDSLFGKLGLKFKLTNGDDFVAQVKAYVEGKTPFIRGTFSQLGQASEVLNIDPKTKPVIFLQLTWSAGDHMVARPTCKTLNDLKGKKIALQKGGPHVGMLDDILRTANLKWKDVTPGLDQRRHRQGRPRRAVQEGRHHRLLLRRHPRHAGAHRRTRQKGDGSGRDREGRGGAREHGSP